MDEGLRSAAQSGNIDALYAMIQGDADLFGRIDQMKFADTPLHIAAAEGHTDFAMELMHLNPSFARKLNQQGLSPIDVALRMQQDELVLELLSVDQDLVRFKGREGYTPLHVVARAGNVPLLSQFLNGCPNCILDLTIRKETALHIAAESRRPEALEALLQGIERNFEGDQLLKRRILNLQDKNGDTVLHKAVANNQPQMIKLLTSCNEVNSNKTNRRGLTALDVLRQQAQPDSESMSILCQAKGSQPRLSFVQQLEHDLSKIKPESSSALLVVLGLILNMTYQALLSPPGSFNDDDGKSVLKPIPFGLFFTANTIAFLMAWFMTIFLLSMVLVAESIVSWLIPLYFFTGFCYGSALVLIAPTVLTGVVTYILAVIIPAIILTYYYHKKTVGVDS